MRLFNNTTKTYKTQENAIKAASQYLDLDKVNWLVGVNTEGRFFVMVKGAEYIHLCHVGICVTD